jgi:hypothetical protein
VAKIPTATCPECGGTFASANLRKLFCRPACSKAYSNRSLARGQAVLGLALAWRAGRHGKTPADKAAASAAFGELCRRLDRIAAEDRAAGRLDALRLYRKRSAAGVLSD